MRAPLVQHVADRHTSDIEYSSPAAVLRTGHGLQRYEAPLREREGGRPDIHAQ